MGKTLEIILIIITLAVLIFQFSLDFISKSKKTKKYIGILVLCLGFISVSATYFLQKKDKREADIVHEKEINDQKDSFNKLGIELKLRNKDLKDIKQQNDSLKVQILKLNEKQDKFITISEISVKEVSKSRIALENMGYKQISRGISQYDKIQMINILKKFKESKIKLATVNGDMEALQFAYQIKEVFEIAGWKTDEIARVIYREYVTGIFVKVKSRNYPLRVNGIFDAFKVINIIAKGDIDPNFVEDDVELIIGTQ